MGQELSEGISESDAFSTMADFSEITDGSKGKNMDFVDAGDGEVEEIILDESGGVSEVVDLTRRNENRPDDNNNGREEEEDIIEDEENEERSIDDLGLLRIEFECDQCHHKWSREFKSSNDRNRTHQDCPLGCEVLVEGAVTVPSGFTVIAKCECRRCDKHYKLPIQPRSIRSFSCVCGRNIHVNTFSLQSGDYESSKREFMRKFMIEKRVYDELQERARLQREQRMRQEEEARQQREGEEAREMRSIERENREMHSQARREEEERRKRRVREEMEERRRQRGELRRKRQEERRLANQQTEILARAERQIEEQRRRREQQTQNRSEGSTRNAELDRIWRLERERTRQRRALEEMNQDNESSQPNNNDSQQQVIVPSVPDFPEESNINKNESSQPQQNEKQEEEDEERLLCKICYENEVDTVLIPCGHAICKNCSKQVQKCPFDRSRIRSRIKLFIS